jgi:hypothetical protein
VFKACAVLHINLQYSIVVATMIRVSRVSLGQIIILPLVIDVIIFLKGKQHYDFLCFESDIT